MDLKQMMADDLKSTFYNTKEFAISVLYKTKTIPALHVNRDELFESDTLFLSFVASDVSDIDAEDIIVLDGKSYQVNNYEYKDEYKLELIVALSEV